MTDKPIPLLAADAELVKLANKLGLQVSISGDD